MSRQTVGVVLLFAVASAPALAVGQPVTVTGVVTDGLEPVAGAMVCGVDWDAEGRIAMPAGACPITDATGTFEVTTTLVDDGGTASGEVVAGADGYRTVDAIVEEGATTDVELALEPLTEPDDSAYAWWRPDGDSVQKGCGQCHTTIYSQWSSGLHATTVSNPRIFDLYDGTDSTGAPGVAPGYKLDHDDAGECGACHAPTASWAEGRSIDLHDIPPDLAWGVDCEACHKIRSVTPGAAPGSDGSITYWRSPWEDGVGGSMQFAFGPYPNVLESSMLSSYSPLMRNAELCAGCHEYTNPQGVVVMDTYSDWRAVGDPEMTLPCQSCHMKDQFNLVPDEEDRMEWLVEDTYVPDVRATSAQRRDPLDVYRHEMWGAIEYAPWALDLQMTARQDGDALVVRTSILNIGANHRVPTGMPFREVVLVVSAVTEDGAAPLELVDGPRVPARGGDLAGEPGLVFAKTLGDEDGNVTFAFWDATQLLEDTRLATAETRDSEFRFRVGASGNVAVRARLLYHRFSQSLAEAKGWDMGEQEIGLSERSVEVTSPGELDAGADGSADAGPPGDYQDGCTCRISSPPPRAIGSGWLALLAVVASSRRAVRRRARPECSR